MNGTAAPTATAAPAEFIDYSDGRHFYVDALPLDAEPGQRYIVAGKYVQIVAGEQPVYAPCARCGGTGKTVFTWVFNGDCFDCGGAVGAGTYRTIAAENKLARARTRAGAKREAARQAKIDARDAAIAELVKAHPLVGTAITWYLGEGRKATEMEADRLDGDFIPTGLGRAAGFVSDLFRFDGKLFDWKIEAIEAAVERFIDDAHAEFEQAQAFAANPAPLGRVEVVGQVVNLKWVPNHFAYNSDTPKILVVTDDGWKVYMTCPRALFDDGGQIEGMRVRFTATLEEHRDRDPQFRIGKSPRKVAVL